MKLTVLISIFFAKIVAAQMPAPDLHDYYGKSYFIMGKAPEIPSERFAIRIDTAMYYFFPEPQLDFELHTSVDNYGQKNISIDIEAPGVKQDPHKYYTMDLNISKVDTNYDGKSLYDRRLLAIGNVKLPSLQANKVEWLDMNLAYGRVNDLEKYQRLKGITLSRFYMGSAWERYDYHHQYGYRSEFAWADLKGDSFFWSDILACSKLEALSLDNQSGELLFIDEELSPLIAKGKMHSIFMQGLPYLPVNFHDFGSFNYISLYPIYIPEAVNLAIVMNNFGKDTSTGNWAQFLTIAKEKTIITPENGPFTTHYLNDQLLCNGAFKNKQPDGKWEFYYDNGQLCEQRFYDNGSKTGNWLFFTPQGDTASIYRYKNGKLMYREDRKQDDTQFCDNPEFTYDVLHKIIYRLDWKSVKDVTISKENFNIVLPSPVYGTAHIGDTIFDRTEHWHFTKDNWEYSTMFNCPKQHDYAEHNFRGNSGEMAYYVHNVHKYISQEKINIVDLKRNMFEELRYNNENPEKIMKLAGKTSGEVFPKKAEKEKSKKNKDDD